MFPFNLDCTFLDNWAQSFDQIDGDLSGISFRKINTKIDVSESKSDVLLSHLNLVKWRWFSRKQYQYLLVQGTVNDSQYRQYFYQYNGWETTQKTL
jgi:hypothetical protein